MIRVLGVRLASTADRHLDVSIFGFRHKDPSTHVTVCYDVQKRKSVCFLSILTDICVSLTSGHFVLSKRFTRPTFRFI